MSRKKKSLISALCNIIIFAATVLCIITFFTKGGEGNMKNHGFVMFRYFTVLSNVFCGAAAACLIPYKIKDAADGKTIMPRWAQIFKFMGTVTVTLTMVVVLVFLLPMTGDLSGMFGGSNLHMHLVGPLLAIYSFCALESDNMLDKKDRLLPLIPVCAYGILYFVMVLVVGEGKGGWPDFYMFNMGGRWYISFIAIAAGSLVISLAEFAVNQRRFKNVRRT